MNVMLVVQKQNNGHYFKTALLMSPFKLINIYHYKVNEENFHNSINSVETPHHHVFLVEKV